MTGGAAGAAANPACKERDDAFKAELRCLEEGRSRADYRAFVDREMQRLATAQAAKLRRIVDLGEVIQNDAVNGWFDADRLTKTAGEIETLADDASRYAKAIERLHDDLFGRVVAKPKPIAFDDLEAF